MRVTLTATRCPSRENTPFPLTARIDRSAPSGEDSAGKTTYCGPFRSDAEEGTTYSFSLALALTNPSKENADYTVYVNWPGPDGDEAATFESSCVSDGKRAECGGRDGTTSDHG